MRDPRAEEAAFAGHDGDHDIVHVRDLQEQLGDAEVVVLCEGVELLLTVDGDDCDPAILGGGEEDLAVELGFRD